MPTESFKDRVLQLALELGWSLWAELGVSGWTRRHSSQAVDLEPLILHTAWLWQFDKRLRDESVDWSVTNSRFVSAVLLKNLLRRSSDEVQASFGDYGATVKVHVRAPWPGEGAPWNLRLSEKSDAADVGRPALIQLRLRAMFGVSARAEVLKLLVSEPARSWTAADLSQLSGYGKPNVTAALDMLGLAGLVKQARVGNTFRFVLMRQVELFALLGDLPGRFPNWAAQLRIVEALLKFATTKAAARSDVRSVEVGALLRQLESWLTAAGLQRTVPIASGTDLNDQFDVWALRLMRSLAQVPELDAAEATGRRDEATYTISRLTMPLGAWMGVVSNPDEPPRSLEMPEWAGLYVEHPRSDTIISDDSVGAPRVAHEILRLAELRRDLDIGDYWEGGDGTNQLVARAFAEERLWPMRAGQSITFGENFMRQWRADRLQRIQPSLRQT